MSRRDKFALAIMAAGALFLSPSVPPAAAQAPSAASSAKPTLDYEFFKARVQPIFIKRRSAEHARCYACHENSRTPHPWGKEFRNGDKTKGFGLEKLQSGNADWTEEQSRNNFEMASRLVVPGNVELSVLLMHPLAPEKGGDQVRLHSGGNQFSSKEDPDWQILAQWVNGATLNTTAPR